MAREDEHTFSDPTKSNPVGTGSTAQRKLEHAPGDESGPQTDGFEHKTGRAANLEQFPSLYGYPDIEVAARSSDVSEKATKVHRKVFRVFHNHDPFKVDEFDHAPNFTATRQYMVANGLRPVGDVSFAGATDYDDRNVDLVYEVEALPAVVAVDPATAHVVVSQDNPTHAA